MKLAPSWSHIGSKLGDVGSKLGSNWLQVGSKLGSNWLQVGSKLAPEGSRGPRLAQGPPQGLPTPTIVSHFEASRRAPITVKNKEKSRFWLLEGVPRLWSYSYF